MFSESKCYIVVPSDRRRTGLPDYENSIFYLNDGYHPNIIAWTEILWWLFTLGKSECPQNAKKVADIYERVHDTTDFLVETNITFNDPDIPSCSTKPDESNQKCRIEEHSQTHDSPSQSTSSGESSVVNEKYDQNRHWKKKEITSTGAGEFTSPECENFLYIFIHFSYIFHTFFIHFSYIFHTFFIHFSYIFHTFFIHFSYIFHTFFIHFSYIFHTFFIHFSYIFHTFFIHFSYIFHTFFIHFYTFLYIFIHFYTFFIHFFEIVDTNCLTDQLKQ